MAYHDATYHLLPYMATEDVQEEVVRAAEGEEILGDLNIDQNTLLTVFSRDWTVETICSQINKGNVDLNPKFQRRNAWTDEKRSKLIESLVMGYPVPEIVLAEVPSKKGTYIVIDGKQRLLTLAGYIYPDQTSSWDTPKLMKLDVLKEISGKRYVDLQSDPTFFDQQRRLMNADIRCTILSGFHDDDILYDIFYRLNTGSVPLSTQELRQVLNRGPFADYLISSTNELQPIHHVLKLKEPDNRLRDIEVILRFFAFKLFGKEYRSNLKKFMDESMGKINRDWARYESEIKKLHKEFNSSIERLSKVFGYSHVGRKYAKGKWEASFNKALFEVQVYYFTYLSEKELQEAKPEKLKREFEKFCAGNPAFIDSIESTTKKLENFRIRFDEFRKLVNRVMEKRIEDTPIS